MRSVYVVPDSIDPPNSGSRIRAHGIRDGLGQLGEVAVLALDEISRSDNWGSMCRQMVTRRADLVDRVTDRFRATLRGSPALLERAQAAGAGPAFSNLLGDFQPDLVVLSRPCFGPFITIARRTGVHLVIDADESLVRAMGTVARSRASAYQRVRALLDGANARRFEPREYPRADQIWVSSAVEQRYFLRTIPGADVRIVPNLAPGSMDTWSPVASIGGVAFVGTYDYAPNEEAAFELMRSIIPAIRATGLPLTLDLIGREPTPAMRREAAALPWVTVSGLVDDPVARLRRAGIALIPIRAGAGSRIKILEAMQAGIPVVSTAKGYEGLDVHPGVELLGAETTAEFTEAALRLERDDALRRRLVDAGQRFVGEHHSRHAVATSVRNAIAALPSSADTGDRPVDERLGELGRDLRAVGAEPPPSTPEGVS